MLMRREMLMLFGLAVSAAALAQPAYPTRPLRLLVGFPPGGTTDIVARAIGEQLALGLGQAVVIDNRPGAAGKIAAEVVAKAPPDGYTLMITSASYALGPSLHRDLTFDIRRDFDHVTVLVDSPFVLAAYPKLPVANLQELIALARSRAGSINFASAGIGSASHLAGEVLSQLAKIELTHVPYKGSSLAMTDLISGRVQIYFTGFTGSLSHVRAGRVRALAVTSVKRNPALPDVATMIESGLKEYRAGSWVGLAMPRGVPAPLMNRISALVQKSLAEPAMEAKLAEHGLEVKRNVLPKDAAQFVAQDVAYWTNVVKRAGLKPE